MSRGPVNRRKKLIVNASLLGCFLALAFPLHAAEMLKAGAPILLPGTHGGFDFIRIDTGTNRLLLAHDDNKTLDVFDLGSRRLVKSVPTGAVQDTAIDLKNERYYLSGNDPSGMVIVSRKTLRILGVVRLPADTDLIGYDPLTGQVHESNDTAAEEWVINPKTGKIVTTIKLKGSGVEELVFDSHYQRLFQAVKGSNLIAVIDPRSNKVLQYWPLAPDAGPHGIALVRRSGGLLVACAGRLLLLSRSTGKILDRADIAPGVDEIAYDPAIHLAYCASRRGDISVVRVSGDKLTALGSVPDAMRTHSIVVDPKTHVVWIAFPKGNQSFVQPFTPIR